jgi:phosphotransferase system HPr (HPr) family protein
MIEKIVVQDPLGIHARPAAALAQALAPLKVRVQVRYGSRSADPRSVIQLLGLGAPAGSELLVELEGEEEEIHKALAAFQEHLGKHA